MPGLTTANWQVMLDPPPTLVPNGLFAYDTPNLPPSAWVSSTPSLFLSYSATALVSTTSPQQGAQCLQITTDTTSFYEGAVVNCGVLALGSYTFSIYVRGNAGGEQLNIVAGGSSPGYNSSLNATTAWVQYTQSFQSDGINPTYVGIRSRTAAAYTFFLDSAAITGGPTLRTPLNLNSGAIQVDQKGIDWGDSQIQTYLADRRIGSIKVDFRIPNRKVTIPLFLSTDPGGVTEEQARAMLQQKVGLIQRESGTLMRQRSGGVPSYADIMDAVLVLPDVWGETGQVEPNVNLILECSPDFYGDEIYLDPVSSVGFGQFQLRQNGLPAKVVGDHQARSRIQLTDTSGNDQQGLLWALRSRHADPRQTAAMTLDAGRLTPLQGATSVGSNLAANGTFEADTSGGAPAAWRTTGGFLTPGATLTAVGSGTTAPHRGTLSMRVVTTASAQEGAATYPTGGVIGGTEYQASFWAKGNVGGEVINTVFGDSASGDWSSTLTFTLTTSWQQYFVTWTPTASRSGATTTGLFIRGTAASIITFFVDDVTINEGDPLLRLGSLPGQSWCPICETSIGLPPRLGLNVEAGYSSMTQTSLLGVGAKVARIDIDGSGQINRVPNPSFEYDTTGAAPAAWSPSAFSLNVGATLTAVTTQHQSGAKSMQVVTTAALTAEGAVIACPGIFRRGVTYTASVQIKGNAGGELVQLLLGNTATDVATTNKTLTTAFQQVTVSWTPFDDRPGSSFGLAVRTNGAQAVTFFVDSVIVVTGAVTPTYFDGDTTGAMWLGTPGNSDSQSTWNFDTHLIAIQAAGAEPILLFSDYSRDVNSMVTVAQRYVNCGVRHIELGNETGYGYNNQQSTSVLSGTATQYADQVKALHDALWASPVTAGVVDVLAQGETGGFADTATTNGWVSKLYTHLPNFDQYIGGWVTHPYGAATNYSSPGGRGGGTGSPAYRVRLMKTLTEAKGSPVGKPIYVTEYGIPSDNGNALDTVYTYGYPGNLTYAQAGQAYVSVISELFSEFPQIATVCVYQGIDLAAHGASSNSFNYFGVYDANQNPKTGIADVLLAAFGLLPAGSSQPAVNLVKNPNFEHDVVGNTPFGWSGAGSGPIGASSTVTASSSAPQSGSKCMAVATPGGAANQGAWINLGPIPGGVQVTASVWLKASLAGQAIGVELEDDHLGNGPAVLATSLSGGWQQYTLTWTPNAFSPDASLFVYLAAGSAAQTLFVDNVSVVYGPTATYADGDTVGWSWLATPGQSLSQQNYAASGLTHQGSYEVWAKVLSPAATPQLRLVWGLADVAHPITNDAVQVPAAAGYYLVDLGQVRLDAPPVGGYAWHGVIQALGAVEGDAIAVRRLYLQPLDEAAGQLQAVQQSSALGVNSQKLAGAGANDASNGGSPAWTSPGNITAFDGQYAQALDAPGAGSVTQYLKSSGHGFAIPSTAVISGIMVEIARNNGFGGDGSTGGAVADAALRLVKAGTVQAGDRANTSTPWPYGLIPATENAIASYGGPADLWGGTWTYADINAAGFGVALSVALFSSSTVGASAVVNMIRVTVFYTVSGSYQSVSDAVCYASQSCELRSDGMFREDSTGLVEGRIAGVVGDLPKLPPASLEARYVELLAKPSRGDLASLPDSASDAFTVQVIYRPSYVHRP